MWSSRYNFINHISALLRRGRLALDHFVAYIPGAGHQSVQQEAFICNGFYLYFILIIIITNRKHTFHCCILWCAMIVITTPSPALGKDRTGNKQLFSPRLLVWAWLTDGWIGTSGALLPLPTARRGRNRRKCYNKHKNKIDYLIHKSTWLESSEGTQEKGNRFLLAPSLERPRGLGQAHLLQLTAFLWCCAAVVVGRTPVSVMDCLWTWAAIITEEAMWLPFETSSNQRGHAGFGFRWKVIIALFLACDLCQPLWVGVINHSFSVAFVRMFRSVMLWWLDIWTIERIIVRFWHDWKPPYMLALVLSLTLDFHSIKYR